MRKRGSQAPGAGASAGRSVLAVLAESPYLQLALVVLVGLLAYANTFQVPFVIDDEASIVDNPAIKNLRAFVFDGIGYSYNPRRFVGYLSLAVNYHLGGLDVVGYHLFNTAVHLANAALVLVLVRLTLKTPIFAASFEIEPPQQSDSARLMHMVPFLAALLFVVHPLQTQAVTYVVQRLASLATLFYLGSLTCYAMARIRQEGSGRLCDPKSASLYLAAVAAALLAMKTKEISFTLPLVIALYEVSFFRTRLDRRILLLVPLVLTMVVVPLGLLHSDKPIGALLGEMDAMARETQDISRGDYLLTQFGVVITYLRLLALPVNQNLDYDYPVYHSLFAPRVFGSLLLLVSLALFAVYLHRLAAAREEPRLRLAAFGIFWFFITLSVESSLIPIRDVIFEHRVYLPSVGIFCTAAALAVPLGRKLSQRQAALLVALVVSVLAAATWQRNQVWGSTVSLWRDCVEKAPRKPRPHNNLANALMAEGRVEEAIPHLQTALRIAPGYAEALRNLGAAYEKTGRVGQAIEQYGEALRAGPGNAFTHYNLAVAYSRNGETDLALAEFQAALRIDPSYADAHNNIGVIYGMKGMLAEAIAAFERAVALDPGSAEAHKNLGFALGSTGQAQRGIEELQRAAALRPEDPEIYNSLGILYANQKRAAEAADSFRSAAALRPEEPKYRDNLYRLQLHGAD